MSLLRRFLNLIVNENSRAIELPWPGVTSLRSIDLGELFYPPGTPPPAAVKVVEELTLPTPTFRFRGSRQGCLPVADRKVLCMDRKERAFLFDAATQHVVTIPTRRFLKSNAVSVFVPSASDDDGDPDGTIFVMPSWPEREKNCPGPESVQFEALVYRRTRMSSQAKSWHCQLLPPLPYLRTTKYSSSAVRTRITSYAVVGGGSHICVSVAVSFVYAWGSHRFKTGEPVGTYCLDTVSHTWSKVGDWTLPFDGKVEYVPEHKLWFGISNNGHLAAADLSAMDSEPQLVGTWEVETDGPAMKWHGRSLFSKHNKLVAYLGAGRFCIADYFDFLNTKNEGPIFERFAVLSGVEVTPAEVHGGSRDDGGEAKLQMIRHKSRLVPSDTCIDAVF